MTSVAPYALFPSAFLRSRRVRVYSLHVRAVKEANVVCEMERKNKKKRKKTEEYFTGARRAVTNGGTYVCRYEGYTQLQPSASLRRVARDVFIGVFPLTRCLRDARFVRQVGKIGGRKGTWRRRSCVQIPKLVRRHHTFPYGMVIKANIRNNSFSSVQDVSKVTKVAPNANIFT